jgi:hypothetical protein
MASSSSVPKRVLVVDLTLDEDVNKCLAGAKRVMREREAIVVVEKKQKSCEEVKENKKVEYDQEELENDLIRLLQLGVEEAMGDCLKLALQCYAPDPELDQGALTGLFVENSDGIFNEVDQLLGF